MPGSLANCPVPFVLFSIVRECSGQKISCSIAVIKITGQLVVGTRIWWNSSAVFAYLGLYRRRWNFRDWKISARASSQVFRLFALYRFEKKIHAVEHPVKIAWIRLVPLNNPAGQIEVPWCHVCVRMMLDSQRLKFYRCKISGSRYGILCSNIFLNWLEPEWKWRLKADGERFPFKAFSQLIH